MPRQPVPSLAIVTATYNRRRLLNRCYRSLIGQTNLAFTWILVDDGSSDETWSDILAWQAESPFPIQALRKKNGGKHTALNLALDTVDADLVLLLDSDDGLYPSAVELVHARAQEILQPGVVGLIANQFCLTTGAPIGTRLPPRLHRSSARALYDALGHVGDTLRVYRSDALCAVRFPEFCSETFLPENVVFDEIDVPQGMLVEHRRLSWVEYQDSGLSANVMAMRHGSPHGYLASLGSRARTARRVDDRLRSATLFWTWSRRKRLTPNPRFMPKGLSSHFGALASLACVALRKPGWMFQSGMPPVDRGPSSGVGRRPGA